MRVISYTSISTRLLVLYHSRYRGHYSVIYCASRFYYGPGFSRTVTISCKPAKTNVSGIFHIEKTDSGEAIGIEKSGCAEWIITIGLAQIYDLQIKYLNNSKSSVAVNLKIIEENRTLIKDSEMHLDN